MAYQSGFGGYQMGAAPGGGPRYYSQSEMMGLGGGMPGQGLAFSPAMVGMGSGGPASSMAGSQGSAFTPAGMNPALQLGMPSPQMGGYYPQTMGMESPYPTATYISQGGMMSAQMGLTHPIALMSPQGIPTQGYIPQSQVPYPQGPVHAYSLESAPRPQGAVPAYALDPSRPASTTAISSASILEALHAYDQSNVVSDTNVSTSYSLARPENANLLASRRMSDASGSSTPRKERAQVIGPGHCNACYEVFTSEVELESHMESAHNANDLEREDNVVSTGMKGTNDNIASRLLAHVQTSSFEHAGPVVSQSLPHTTRALLAPPVPSRPQPLVVQPLPESSTVTEDNSGCSSGRTTTPSSGDRGSMPYNTNRPPVSPPGSDHCDFSEAEAMRRGYLRDPVPTMTAPSKSTSNATQREDRESDPHAEAGNRPAIDSALPMTRRIKEEKADDTLVNRKDDTNKQNKDGSHDSDTTVPVSTDDADSRGGTTIITLTDQSGQNICQVTTNEEEMGDNEESFDYSQGGRPGTADNSPSDNDRSSVFPRQLSPVTPLPLGVGPPIFPGVEPQVGPPLPSPSQISHSISAPSLSLTSSALTLDPPVVVDTALLANSVLTDNFSCKLCNYQGRSLHCLTKHYKAHTTAYKICKMCGKAFERPSDLLRHEERHFAKGGITKPSPPSPDRKLLKMKRGRNKSYRCRRVADCKFSTTEQYKLALHYRMAHNDYYKCDQCSMKFISAKTLETHKAQFHAGLVARLDTFTCSVVTDTALVKAEVRKGNVVEIDLERPSFEFLNYGSIPAVSKTSAAKYILQANKNYPNKISSVWNFSPGRQPKIPLSMVPMNSSIPDIQPDYSTTPIPVVFEENGVVPISLHATDFEEDVVGLDKEIDQPSESGQDLLEDGETEYTEHDQTPTTTATTPISETTPVKTPESTPQTNELTPTTPPPRRRGRGRPRKNSRRGKYTRRSPRSGSPRQNTPPISEPQGQKSPGRGRGRPRLDSTKASVTQPNPATPEQSRKQLLSENEDSSIAVLPPSESQSPHSSPRDWKRRGHYTCVPCNYSTNMRFKYQQHLKAHEGRFVCKICGKACIKGSDLFRHYPTHNIRGTNGELICDSCDYTTPKKEVLEEHMKNHYRLTTFNESHMYARCGLCNKRFHRTRLFQHKRQVHGRILKEQAQQLKTHACAVCDKQFISDKELTDHIQKKHGNGDVDQTVYEQDRIQQATELSQSVNGDTTDCSPSPEKSRIKREPRDPNGYVCKYCGKTFAFKTRLAQHTRLHEVPGKRGRKPKSRRGKQRCDVCKKTFKSFNYLQQHMLLHTGEKPYSCDNCDAAFSLLQSLQAHQKRKCSTMRERDHARLSQDDVTIDYEVTETETDSDEQKDGTDTPDKVLIQEATVDASAIEMVTD